MRSDPGAPPYRKPPAAPDAPAPAPTLARAPASASTLDDSALVDAARRDPHAFAALYERYADQVWRYARDRAGSAAAADDLTGDTFVAALESLPRFDPARGSFAGWLFTIANRRIADHGRRVRRGWRVIPAGWFGPPEEEDALETVLRRDEAGRLRAALATLSDADRDVVLLRYSAGLSSVEIAEALGLSDAAARARLSRALRRLATRMGGVR